MHALLLNNVHDLLRETFAAQWMLEQSTAIVLKQSLGVMSMRTRARNEGGKFLQRIAGPELRQSTGHAVEKLVRR